MATAAQMKQFYQELEAATPLPLAREPRDIVPGEGDPASKVLLIGEAPGEQEAVQRRPFVGRSGKLLRKTLEEVGLPANKVWISNIVKARPPQNRDPSPAEIAAYRPWLNKEIELLDPDLIVTLGRLSMAKFLPKVKISQVHGRIHKVVFNNKTLLVLPMYHPAAALRGTKVKTAFTQDFAKIPKLLTWLAKQHQIDQFSETVLDALT